MWLHTLPTIDPVKTTQFVFSMGPWLDVDSGWNVMAHGDAREGKWRGNWRMEWIASTLYTISEHGVSSITTADAHTSAASSRLNRRPRRFKWTGPFRRKTKSGFCACAITFQLASIAEKSFTPLLQLKPQPFTQWPVASLTELPRNVNFWGYVDSSEVVHLRDERSTINKVSTAACPKINTTFNVTVKTIKCRMAQN